MSERFPERETYGRGDGRSQRARWRDEDERSAAQYGPSRRSRRNELASREEFDEDYGAGGYGGEYGQAMSGNYDSQRQSPRWRMRGPSHYREQDEWDRDYRMQNPEHGQYAYGWSGPSPDIGDRIYRANERYGRGYGQDWGGGYGQAYQSGGYYGEPGRNYLTRGGRQQWGRFSGRGPKGYTRSDERIREDINDRLTEDPELDATDVDVRVSNCDVTLTGLVEGRQDKRRAEDLAESVPGVRNVQNNLRIQAQGEEEPTRTSRRGGSRGEASMQ